MPIDATTTSSSQQTSLCIHVKKLRLILEKRRAAKEANRKTRKNGDGENVGKRRSLKNVFDKPKLNRERIVDGGGGQFNDNSNMDRTRKNSEQDTESTLFSSSQIQQSQHQEHHHQQQQRRCQQEQQQLRQRGDNDAKSKKRKESSEQSFFEPSFRIGGKTDRFTTTDTQFFFRIGFHDDERSDTASPIPFNPRDRTVGFFDAQRRILMERIGVSEDFIKVPRPAMAVSLSATSVRSSLSPVHEVTTTTSTFEPLPLSKEPLSNEASLDETSSKNKIICFRDCNHSSSNAGVCIANLFGWILSEKANKHLYESHNQAGHCSYASRGLTSVAALDIFFLNLVSTLVLLFNHFLRTLFIFWLFDAGQADFLI